MIRQAVQEAHNQLVKEGVKVRKAPSNFHIISRLYQLYPEKMKRWASILDPVTWGTHVKRPPKSLKKKLNDKTRELKWTRYVFIYGEPACEVCGSNDGPTFRSRSLEGRISTGWPPTCSFSCAHGSKSSKDRRKAYSLSKHGTNHPTASLIVQAKSRATMLRRHGVEYAQQSPAILAKTRKTSLKRYGHTHAMQDPQILYRQQISAFRTHDLVVNGITYTGLQGYEGPALLWMLTRGITVYARNHERYFTVPYVDGSGRSRSYHPDFVARYCKYESVIEVKSPWTAGLSGKPHLWRDLHSKAAATEAAGKRFLLLHIMTDGRLFIHRGVPRRSVLLKDLKRESINVLPWRGKARL